MAPQVVNDVAGSDLLEFSLDTFPSNIAIVDADGRILATNSAWREFAEANSIRTSPASVGVNYLDVAEVAEDPSAERAAAGLRAVLQGERERFELEYPCHSPDEKRWFLLRVAAFTRGGDRYATVSHVDITERTRRERALREAYEISASDRPFSEKVDDLLELGCDVFGLEFGTLSHIQDEEYTFESVVTPADADLSAGDTAPLTTLPDCEQVFEAEETLVLSDVRVEAPELLDPEWGVSAYLGAPVVVNEEVQGTFCFYSTEARDEQFSEWEVTFFELLSDWVSDALERRHYTNLLGALETAFPDLAFLIDTDGTYLDYLVNPAMTDRLAAGRDDFRGQTLHENLPGETADMLLATVREAIDTGQPQTVEYELDVPAGIRWFEGRVAPVAHGMYGPDTVLVVARDITDRKEREQELQETSEMLRSVQQTMASTDSLESKLEDLLAFGREYMDVEQGFLARIDDETLWIRAAVGTDDRIQTGVSVPLSETYCRHTVDADTSLVVEDASEEGWAGDVAFERFGLDCYVGTTVSVDGDVYGTLCFIDRTPAEDGFTDPQRTFVELLGEWVSYELEQREREQQYRQLTERISDAYYAFDADWTVTYWNDTTADRVSIPAEEIVGENVWDQFPELEGTVYEETLREAMDSQKQRSCEFYYEAGDYWIEVQAYPDDDGISVISQEITERKEAREALRESQERLDAFVTATSDVVYRMSADWSEMIYLDGQELLVDTDEPQQTWLEQYIPPDERPKVTAAIEEAIETKSRFELEHQVMQADGTRGWTHSRAVPILDDGEIVEWFGTASDITERKEQEQELQQRRDELAQLNRLNTLVRQLIQALQDTDSREAIETAVCNRLTESELYQSAWVGVRGSTVSGEQTMIPQTAAGIDRSHLDGISNDWSVMKTAVQTGDVHVVEDVAQADGLPAAHREHALELGHEAVAAVPLTTGEVTYGVLAVYPPSDQTICDAERTVLADLGQMIAQAIQRVHSRHALTAEAVIRLALQIPDPGLALGDVSTEFDCELTLEQEVTTDDEGVIYYLDVRDADPEQVCEFLRETPVDGEFTVVRDADGGTPSLIECSLDERPSLPMDVLNDYGGSVRTVRITDGDLFLGVELPPSVDVRTVVDALEEVVSSVHLISKQYVDRPIETTPDPWSRFTEKLTTKQEAALEAAYARGYYDWPREVTVEELAETFDITAPTLHYRLRHAHQTVVSAIVDGTQGRKDTT